MNITKAIGWISLIFCSIVCAHDAHDNSNNDDRCGTADPTPEDMEADQIKMSRFQTRRSASCVGCIQIETVFHMIRDDRGIGGLTQKEIAIQMVVLNAAYNNTAFQFILNRTTYMNNANWTNNGSKYKLDIADSLREGSYKTLNVFWVNTISPTAVGENYNFPSANHHIVNSNYDGIQIKIGTQPGGGNGPFDQGLTLVHEVGHWLGLYHVFYKTYGIDCNANDPGDYIADTPVQKATIGCPVESDSCPDLPGKDLIENYMDYSYDRCLTSFTPNQVERMYAQWKIYREDTFTIQTVVPKTTSPASVTPTTNNTPTTSAPTSRVSATPTTLAPKVPSPTSPAPTTVGSSVTSPVTSAPVKVKVPTICFSGETTVEVKDRGTIIMARLAIGDKVLVSSGEYEVVYSFGHRHESAEAEYLHFLPSNLEISEDHMVKIGSHYVPASAVRIGDQVETDTGDMMTIETIRRVARKGAYAPFTMSGTIVVSNIKVSSYVAFQDSAHLKIGGLSTPLSFQWLAHLSQAPYRVWARVFGETNKEKYTHEGISTRIYAPYHIWEWYLQQNAICMIVLVVPALIWLQLASAVEVVVLSVSRYSVL